MKINWFNSEKYCFHWSFSEKVNHWLNQWKFDWFRLREYSLKTCKSLKLVNHVMNQFNHRNYSSFLIIVSEILHTGVDVKSNFKKIKWKNEAIRKSISSQLIYIRTVLNLDSLGPKTLIKQYE